MSGEIAAGIAYIAVAAKCTPPLARWIWPHWHEEYPLTATKREAILIGAILAVIWPVIALRFGLSRGLDWAVRRIFGDAEK